MQINGFYNPPKNMLDLQSQTEREIRSSLENQLVKLTANKRERRCGSIE